MTRIIHGTGIGVTHGAGDGLSEFPSDLADVGTAGSAVAFSVRAFDTSALVTLASCIRGSDASALPMRVLVAGRAAAVADSMIKPVTFRGDRDGSLGNRFMTIVKPFRFFVVSTHHSPHHFAVRNRCRERLNPTSTGLSAAGSEPTCRFNSRRLHRLGRSWLGGDGAKLS